MYIPKLNLMVDNAEIVSFMKRYSFATIISSKDNIPTATHLPFMIEQKDDGLVLISHFARANNHWEDIESSEILVIFTEPHAYISPSHYDKELNVPTWNYIAVHAYGKGKLIHEPDAVLSILESTILTYEEGYKAQWDGLPSNYKTKMAKGIVAFEIKVHDLQAKSKLSQNKTENEKNNIIETLSKSEDSVEREVANYMKKVKANIISHESLPDKT